MSIDLLPCPMCGCAATFVKHSAGMPGTQGFDKWDAVACKHCRATVGACDRRFRCREDAAAAWNRRVAAPSPSASAREPIDAWYLLAKTGEKMNPQHGAPTDAARSHAKRNGYRIVELTARAAVMGGEEGK